MAAGPNAPAKARRLACPLAATARRGSPGIGQVSAPEGKCIRDPRERLEYESFYPQAPFARSSSLALALSDEFHKRPETQANIRSTRRPNRDLFHHDEIRGRVWRDTGAPHFPRVCQERFGDRTLTG